jgi:hypothetical protein
MKVSPKNTDYQEFLSIISAIKTIEKHTISINYEHQITGTLEQLNEGTKETESIDLKRFIFDLNESSNVYLSDIEIMHYLKKMTNNFDLDFTKEALFELEVFENMVFNETMIEAVQEKYENEGWEIPTYEKKNIKSGEIVVFNDYKKMEKKVFPFTGMQLYFAKQYLQKSLTPQQSKKQNPELIINQIALLYVYSGKQITRENANNIVKEYGHNSGEKLFQRFTYYSSTANRKGKPINCTPKKLDNKIKLLESVIELLDTGNQKRVKDEVLMLKTRYESEYQ